MHTGFSRIILLFLQRDFLVLNFLSKIIVNWKWSLFSNSYIEANCHDTS